MEKFYVKCVEIWTLSQSGKNKKWKQLPKVPEAHVYGWVHTPGNDLVITCLPIVTRPPNRCFSPLSFLSFLSWPLLTSNVFNVRSSYVKGRYGKFVCEMSGNLNFASRQGKTENGNNCWKGPKHKCMAGFTPGRDQVIIGLPKLTRSPNRCFSPLLSFPSFLY